MPNKGFALLAAGQFETRLQEFGLRGSYLDGTWEAMLSITTFLTYHTMQADMYVKDLEKLFFLPSQKEKYLI